MDGMTKHVIGIAGVKGVGKTTWVKKYLPYTPNSTRMAFADGLKDLVCKLLDIDRTQLEVYKNKEFAITRLQYDFLKWCSIIAEEVGCDECFILEKLKTKDLFTSVRDLLQWLGTEVIRAYDKDWHVNRLVERVKNSDADTIFVDDVRFPNEKAVIENLGGFCLYLKRESVTSKANDSHSSETSITEDMFDNQEVIVIDDCENPDNPDDDEFNSIIAKLLN